jgi:putative flippase GtrA
MLTRSALVARYVAFAIASTLVNFAAQQASLGVYHGVAAVHFSILVGTGAGFVLKYVLDKRFIFFDASAAPAAEAGKVLVYGVTGLVTTAIFWGFELGAWWVFGSTAAKYAGGAVGLAIGYVAKYQLDRRFVFADRSAPC